MTDLAGASLIGLEADLSEAADALQAFADGPAKRAAQSVEESFSRAGEAIARELGRAARTGEADFRRMAGVILADLAKLAIDRVFSGAGASAAGLFGARAFGGPVTPGGGYLVGERGPEVFYPSSAGRVASAGERAVTVNISIGAGANAETLLREEGRIAASLARAVGAGSRYL